MPLAQGVKCRGLGGSAPVVLHIFTVSRTGGAWNRPRTGCSAPRSPRFSALRQQYGRQIGDPAGTTRSSHPSRRALLPSCFWPKARNLPYTSAAGVSASPGKMCRTTKQRPQTSRSRGHTKGQCPPRQICATFPQFWEEPQENGGASPTLRGRHIRKPLADKELGASCSTRQKNVRAEEFSLFDEVSGV